ncbi:MAG: hydroxyacid dehydrogenase [Acidobacteriia bacterium]|nr:hydroxyacid dehydrogenase [Terriglobia bacterium]
MTVEVLCLRPRADFERVEALPPPALEVVYRAPGDADVPALMKRAKALVIPAVGPKLPPSLFEESSVVLVQVTGAGMDRLDAATLQRLGIPAANVPGGSNSAVAEYVMTCASVLLRRLCWADNEIRRGNYVAFRARMLADNLAGLDGLLVGVVGLGTIGMAVAEAFHKVGCRICYFDPAPRDPAGAAALQAKSLPLEELLKNADVITLHVPLLPETQGLIGDRELASMKAGAVLIQASRGGIVDEAALARFLQSGSIAGAAIDVYSAEPPAADHPLLALEGEAARRVLFTPHIAGVTRQSAALLYRAAWRNVHRVTVENQPPLNRVY